MVQKPVTSEDRRPRGRPRGYDRDKALGRALQRFWQTGYAATSLDDLAEATGMNRPSLYAAFGDKRSLYIEALEHYWAVGLAAMKDALVPERSLREGLLDVYRKALGMYLPVGATARGCFAIGTATTEAYADAKIRAVLIGGLRAIDAQFEQRFRTAREQGELRRDADPRGLAILASATLHTLAIRSRAGATAKELTALAKTAVDTICGPKKD